MITGVDHAQVNIPSDGLDAARAFYVDFLGFREIARPATFGSPGIWLLAGDFELHLGVEDGMDRRRTRAHLAYRVTDIAGWRKRIAARGWEIVEQPEIPGCARFHFRDPFGNNIELIQKVAADEHR